MSHPCSGFLLVPVLEPDLGVQWGCTCSGRSLGWYARGSSGNPAAFAARPLFETKPPFLFFPAPRPADPCPGPPAVTRTVPALHPTLPGFRVDAIHPSHRLVVRSRTVICLKCGKWATTRNSYGKPCKPPTKAGQASIARWNRGLYPDPKGHWPSAPS